MVEGVAARRLLLIVVNGRLPMQEVILYQFVTVLHDVLHAN